MRKRTMKKTILLLLLFPFAGYGQEITITQSQKIDLKLPTREQPVQNPHSKKAKGLLILGAVISAAGVGVGLSGPVDRPQRDKVYRQIGAGVFAVGAGFTVSGIVKME